METDDRYRIGDLYLIEFTYTKPNRSSEDVPFFRARCFTWEDKYTIGEVSITRIIKDKSTGDFIEETIELPKQVTERKKMAINGVHKKLIEWHEKRGWKRTSKKDAEVLTFSYGKNVTLEIKNFKCVRFNRKIL